MCNKKDFSSKRNLKIKMHWTNKFAWTVLFFSVAFKSLLLKRLEVYTVNLTLVFPQDLESYIVVSLCYSIRG